MKMIKLFAPLLLALAGLLSISSTASAAGGGGNWDLQDPKIDIGNKDSLRRGAQTFVNYCLGCHSLKYIRWSSLIEDFDIDEATLDEKLRFTGDSANDYMDTVMPAERSAKWLGITPPDLSLTVREKGDDWMYTFLTSFYADPESKTGAANALWGGGDPSKAQLSMPFVLSKLQGWQQPVITETTTVKRVPKLDDDGNKIYENNELVTVEKAEVKQLIKSLEPSGKGALTTEEFNQRMRDLTNFLAYAAEPGRSTRHEMGVWVLALLLIFTIVAYLLKKEYWKDVQ